MTKKTKKVTKRKTTKITDEISFRQSLPSLKAKPFAIINYTNSIINAIIYCECGNHLKKAQGPHSNFWNCPGCGSAYALSEYVSVSKLTKKQMDYLKSRKNIALE